MTVAKVPVVLSLVLAFAGCDEAVKVSSFGYDPEDSTEIIQKAIDSGAPKIVLDRQAGPWITRPLFGRSNLEIVFEDGVELVAKRGEFRSVRDDKLLRFDCASNVTIRGLGKAGGTLRMWKSDYLDPKQNYARSEWRHALLLNGVRNVLIENMSFRASGGDGITLGKPKAAGSPDTQNVTIRKCVCDDNHRQGISVCSGDGVLIEDCILSNTKGTAPEAGIDLEPDRPDETIANITLRNVVSKDNAGNGFDVYLQQMRDFSKPVSLRFENCRSVGNRYGTSVTGADLCDSRVVKGEVSFVGCAFADTRKEAIRICGTPAGALDVVFRDCTVSNATKDVLIEAGTSLQGPADGITFENLSVFQPVARPWCAQGRPSFGPVASDIRGNVTLVAPDGKRETVLLDRRWIEKNLPAPRHGKSVAPRVELPPSSSVTVVDAKPGELADLAPVALVWNGTYVFHVARPGTVRFVARQQKPSRERPAAAGVSAISRLVGDGRKELCEILKIPGYDSTELAFEAKQPGFYTLVFPLVDVRWVLEKSSVPVAIDTSEMERTCSGLGGQSFSLWFHAPGDRAVSVCTSGDSYYRFKMKIIDPLGSVFTSEDAVEMPFVTNLQSDQAIRGLWRLDFSASDRPHYGWIRVALSGIPGALFLSSEKYWR